MTTKTMLRSLGSLQRDAAEVLRVTRGCRPDMHEPDEQGVSARVEGRVLDNAGTPNEMRVLFLREGDTHGPVVQGQVNLASLVALARVGANALLDEVVR